MLRLRSLFFLILRSVANRQPRTRWIVHTEKEFVGSIADYDGFIFR